MATLARAARTACTAAAGSVAGRTAGVASGATGWRAAATATRSCCSRSVTAAPVATVVFVSTGNGWLTTAGSQLMRSAAPRTRSDVAASAASSAEDTTGGPTSTASGRQDRAAVTVRAARRGQELTVIAFTATGAPADTARRRRTSRTYAAAAARLPGSTTSTRAGTATRVTSGWDAVGSRPASSRRRRAAAASGSTRHADPPRLVSTSAAAAHAPACEGGSFLKVVASDVACCRSMPVRMWPKPRT